MKIAPSHPHLHLFHRKHKFHRTFLVVSAILSLVSFSLLGTLYLKTSIGASQQTLFTLEITETGAAPVESPSTSGGGSSSTVFPSPILKKPEKKSPTPLRSFRVALLDEQGKEHPSGIATDKAPQTKIPVIRHNQPAFRGNIDLPFAVLILELHSEPESALTATIQTDETGSWEFTAPEPLEEGWHILYVTMFDPQSEIELGRTILQFRVAGSEAVTPPAPAPPLPPPPSFYEQDKLEYDVSASIPNTYQTINPGQDLLVQIDIVNPFPESEAQKITLLYKIKNEQDEIVLEQKETLVVSQPSQTFARLFRTGYRLEPGKYGLEIYLPYPDGRLAAFSTIDFEINGPPVLTLTSGRALNLTLIFQVLSLLLTAFGLIAYYELKQVQSLSRIIHQITEQDLLAKGLIHKF